MHAVTALTLLGTGSLHALQITEIMYDPLGSDTGREWVELYNDENTAVDASSFKLFEGGVNHGISSYQGNLTLEPGAYAVLADNPSKFLTDYPTYSGQVFDSVFSLSQSGEALVLRKGTSDVFSYTYVPIAGSGDDGTTLSYLDSSWAKGRATPGAKNERGDDSQIVASSSVGTGGTVAPAVVAKSLTFPDLVLVIEEDRTVMAGMNTEYRAQAFTRAGTRLDASYTWSFGDGGSATGATTSYRFLYPGTYDVRIEGKTSSTYGVGTMRVRVVPAEVAITDMASDTWGGYIALTNNARYTLDIGNARFVTLCGTFEVPYGTLLSAATTQRISLAKLGVPKREECMSQAALVYPQGEILHAWVRGSQSGSGSTTNSVAQNNAKSSVKNGPNATFAAPVPASPSPLGDQPVSAGEKLSTRNTISALEKPSKKSAFANSGTLVRPVASSRDGMLTSRPTSTIVTYDNKGTFLSMLRSALSFGK